MPKDAIDDSGFQPGSGPWSLEGDGVPNTRPPGFDVYHPWDTRAQPIQTEFQTGRPDLDGHPYPDDPRMGQTWFYSGSLWYWDGVEWVIADTGGGSAWIPPYVLNKSDSVTPLEASGITTVTDLYPTSFLSPDLNGYPNPDFVLPPWGKADIVFHVHVQITTTSGTPLTYAVHVYTDTHDEPNVYSELTFGSNSPLNFAFLLRHSPNEVFHIATTPYGGGAGPGYDIVITAVYGGPWFASED